MKELRVLVIEDELLVGLDIITALESAGFEHLKHVATEKEALQQIQSERWDAVVADANLNGSSIEQVAKLLLERNISFLIVTGYERQNLPQAVRGAPVLSKPFSHPQLSQAVLQLCSRQD